MLNQRVPLRDVLGGGGSHALGALPTVMDSCTDSCSFGKEVDLQKELLLALQNNDIQLFTSLLQRQDPDGNKIVNPDYQYGDPHYATCLELACKGKSMQAYIKLLLANNANPNNINPVRNKAPIHITIENHNHEALAALLQDQRTDVNIVDNFGNTALHIAAKNFKKDPVSMDVCVRILMCREDCKINKRNRKGRTALEEAANFGGRKAVEVILKYGKDKVDIDDKDVSDQQTVRDILLKKFPDLELPSTKPTCNNEDHETLKTLLFKLLYFKKYEEFIQKMEFGVTKDLLDADDGKNTFLQYVCECGLSSIVKYLLSKGANPNAVISTNRKPPVFLACSGGYYDILLLLLQYNANVAPLEGKTLLHCVVKGKQIKSGDSDRQYRKCFQLLLERKNELNLEINATDENGNTALHYAVKEKDQHYVKALLKHGAYIGLPNNFGYSPLADIDPTTFGDFLDDCVTSNGKYRRDDKYELTFKYSFLEPLSCTTPLQSSEEHELNSDDEESGPTTHYRHPLLPEMYALHYICKSQDLRPLLKHPVLLSFLYLKWSHIRMYFFANLLFFALFVTILTVYVLKDCRGEPANATANSNIDENIRHTDMTGESLLWVSLCIFLFGFVSREVFQMLMNPKRYFCSLENYMEMILIGVTFAVVSEKWDSPCIRVTYSIAILLSWTELFMQVGRIHSLSTYNEMMKRVLWNYTKFLVWDSLLIIAFALGFYTIFHEMVYNKNDEEINFFQNPAMSLFKTVIMLTGEFDSASLPFDIVPIVSYAMFILFIFLVPVVMVNLLHGLAVSDTQAIKEDAELVSIESLIELIFYFENMLLGDTVTNCFQYHCCWSQSFAQRFLNMHKTFTKFFLFPNTLRHKELRVNPNFSHKIFVSNTVHPKQTQDSEEKIGSCCCTYFIVANCCTMDKGLLKTAMDIIDKKSDLSEIDIISRLESIETKVLKIQDDLERLLKIQICQG